MTLLDYLFAKETVTRNAVVGTVFVGSGLPDYQLNTTTAQLTTGYTELVRLLKEPTTVHGRSALRQFCARTRHGNAGVGRRGAPRRDRNRKGVADGQFQRC